MSLGCGDFVISPVHLAYVPVAITGRMISEYHERIRLLELL